LIENTPDAFPSSLKEACVKPLSVTPISLYAEARRFSLFRLTDLLALALCTLPKGPCCLAQNISGRA
jgi:hypothetical protein